MAANYRETCCDGKDKLSAGRARKVAEQMRRRGRAGVQPYHCVHCGEWHVGNSIIKQAERRRA